MSGRLGDRVILHFDYKGCSTQYVSVLTITGIWVVKEAPINILQECIIRKLIKELPEASQRQSFEFRRQRAEEKFSSRYQVTDASSISTRRHPIRDIVIVQHDEGSDLGVIECYIDDTLRRCVQGDFQSIASQMFFIDHHCRNSKQTLSTISSSSAGPITIGADQPAHVSVSRIHVDNVAFNKYDQLVIPSRHYLTSNFQQHIWAYYQSRSSGAFFQFFNIEDYDKKWELVDAEFESGSSRGSRSATED